MLDGQHDAMTARAIPVAGFPLRLCLIVLTVVATGGALAQGTLPSAPQVVSGSVSILQQNNQQTITQGSHHAIVNWGSFSIGADNKVNFVQPGSTSVILNRVTGKDPSSIFGSLSANGQVFLLNPNGIFFAPGSRVDVAGLVASTMAISDKDFLSGHYAFSRTGSAALSNAGSIQIREGGYVVLAADQVSNAASGQINAPGGKVLLISADRLSVETNGNSLIGYSVEGDSLRQVARVENAGIISAEGGLIAMSARGANLLEGMVVNNTGTLKASGVEEHDGTVILSASSGLTQSSGTIDVQGKKGGRIEITNQQGTAAVAGTLNAQGSSGKGGEILVVGKQTGLFSGAHLQAGGAHGGTVLVGGDWQGAKVGAVSSELTFVSQSADIDASGSQGSGGKVVVWADDSTRFDGRITATGKAGDGGNVEVSGKQNLAFNGQVDLRSDTGGTGTLLLDPSSITIAAGVSGTGAFDAGFTGTILEAVLDSGANTISTGTLEGIASTTNIRLEATEQIKLNDLSGGTLDLKQTSGHSATFKTINSSASGGIVFANKNDTIKTAGGNLVMQAGGSGSIDIGKLNAGSGNINLTSAGSILTGNLDAGGTVSYSTPGSVGQRSGTRVKAATVSVLQAGNFDLGLDNQVDNFAASMSGNNLNFKSVNGLTVNTVSVTGSGQKDVNIRSDGSMLVAGPVSVTTDNASGAHLDLSASGNVAVQNNITAQGGGSFGSNTAFVSIRSDNGHVIQSAGQIKAHDIGAQQPDQNQLAHYSRILLQANQGSVSANNLLAQSDGGRAQVDVNAKGNIGLTGTIKALAASQPGVSINAQYNDGNANVDTTGASILASQTAEVVVPASGVNPASYKDINKVADKVGGIGILGNTLNLGSLEVNSTAASGTALYGIATNSNSNTTFNQVVKTNADAGISVSTPNDATILTSGSGLLQSKALSITGDRDKAIFNLKTDVASLTVLGGRGVIVDNSAHGSGTLVISALGRISEASHDSNTNTDIPATNKPVGGVMIISQNIKLLSMDNRSTHAYLASGTQTTPPAFYADGPRQDLQLIADNIEHVPGTIATRDDTYLQLKPFTAGRNINVVYALPVAPVANTTYYTAGPTGLLYQFNPKSNVLIGGTGYKWDIGIGTPGDTVAKQISLGSMTLRFETKDTGRVYNYYSLNPNTPTNWKDGPSDGGPPYQISPTIACLSGKACLTAMTKDKIYIKDSLNQGDPARPRNVVIAGTGSGAGGTKPPDTSVGGGDGGGGSGGGSSGGGGGGSGSNGNDSQPGGSNAPPDGPSGGGNDGSATPGSGTTTVVNNPGSSSGNPGGGGGDSNTPPDAGGGSTPGDAGGSDGGALGGGGEFSGGSGGGSGGGSSGSGSGGDSGGSDPGGSGGGPSGGGTLSDGSEPGDTGGGPPGGSGGTDIADGGGSGASGGGDGFGGGGSGGEGGGFGGGDSGDGGGTLSDGSTPGGSGGADVADGGGSGASGGADGFGGGGSGGEGGGFGGGDAGDGGGTLSDGSTPGGSGGTNVADGGSSGASGGADGFGGGGSGGSGGEGGGFGAGLGSGGGLLSDGSDASGTGGSQFSGFDEGTTLVGYDNFGGSGGAGGNQGADAGPTTLAQAEGLGGNDTAGLPAASEFAGGGTSSNSDVTPESQAVASASEAGSQPADGSAGDTQFKGGASGGDGDAMQLASNPTQAETLCADQADAKKSVSLPGQNPQDLLNVQATGVRVSRSDSGNRRDCPRGMAIRSN